MIQNDVDLVTVIVQALVDKPEAVKVERTTDEMGVLLSLSIDAGDMGKVIGRAGDNAKAIRTILRAYGMKNNARVNLKILEPYRGEQGDQS